MKDDLISRKTAIEEMLKCGEYYNGNDEAKRGVAQCIGVIHELPSAQPEKHTEERTETHACDSISRRAAIDALIRKIRPHNNGDGTITMCVMSEELVRKTLDDLPSAQPEIIRCKDCKYFKVEYAWNCASYPICEVSPQRIITPDDYCSFAERRTDENNND